MVQNEVMTGVAAKESSRRKRNTSTNAAPVDIDAMPCSAQADAVSSAKLRSLAGRRAPRMVRGNSSRRKTSTKPAISGKASRMKWASFHQKSSPAMSSTQSWPAEPTEVHTRPNRDSWQES
jgi:hypothetical protein